MRVPAAGGDSALAADLVSMREAMLAADARRRRNRRVGLMVMPPLVVAWLGQSIWLASRFGAFAWGQLIPLSCLVGIFGWSYWKMWRGVPARTSREMAAGLLSCGRCPSCTYKIGHVVEDHDGCVVCPECGAAWRMGDGRAEMADGRSE